MLKYHKYGREDILARMETNTGMAIFGICILAYPPRFRFGRGHMRLGLQYNNNYVFVLNFERRLRIICNKRSLQG